MRYRPLGRTGLQVSEIGFGAASWWGKARFPEIPAARLVDAAIAGGVTFFDTGASYSDGNAEPRLGRVLKGRNLSGLVIASKAGTFAQGGRVGRDFSPAAVVASAERSLRNLGLDTVDVQQFHVWSDEWVDRGSWRDGIEQLKADGKIRAFGVSINDHQPANAIKLIESGAVDTVQVIYNIFDQ